MSALFDVMLDPDTGDLPDVVYLDAGPARVVQSIRIALQTFVGEWALDVEEGLIDVAWLAERPFPLAAFGARTTATIEAVEGVDAVLEVEATFDSTSRGARYAAQVVIGDTTISITLEPGEQVPGNANPWASLNFRAEGILGTARIGG